MTDRDYFAAAALTGLLAAPTDKDRSMEHWARLAYESADAMLRERKTHDPVPVHPAARHTPATRGDDGLPPDVPQPDNGLATSGRGHYTQQDGSERNDSPQVCEAENQTYLKTNGKRPTANMIGEWIPATDRLPPDRTVVLAWSGKRVAFGYISDGQWIDTLYGWYIPNGPTHWMPLPEPPVGAK